MTTMRRQLLTGMVAAVTALAAGASPASAAGYDTPILYSARHMGMGGTAIGYVRDPSAIYHNPAGLGRIGTASILGDLSLIMGHITAAPVADGESLVSELTVAPAFLLGGAYRITEWLSAGLAIYPVASAGGEYKYNGADGAPQTDLTSLIFFEFSPAIAITLPYNLHIGLGYRISLIQFERVKGPADDPKFFNLDMSGMNWAGFRLGMQWQPIPELGVGLNYRFKTRTEVTAETSNFINQDLNKTSTEFILPAQFGVGLRGDLGNVGVALDLQYTFNSQVSTQTYIAEQKVDTDGDGTPDVSKLPAPLAVDNVARWRDNWTLRAGAEYRFDTSCVFGEHIAARIGYVYDGQVANGQYPSAFGTPPVATQTGTAGVGFDAGAWEVNLAYAYRTGAVDVLPEEKGPLTCLACAKSGYYAIELHGVYLDFSYDFE